MSNQPNPIHPAGSVAVRLLYPFTSNGVVLRGEYAAVVTTEDYDQGLVTLTIQAEGGERITWSYAELQAFPVELVKPGKCDELGRSFMLTRGQTLDRLNQLFGPVDPEAEFMDVPDLDALDTEELKRILRAQIDVEYSWFNMTGAKTDALLQRIQTETDQPAQMWVNR